MFPLIDNRTYNQLVVENLSQLTTSVSPHLLPMLNFPFLTSRHNSKTKKFLRSNEIFPIESYIQLLEFINRPNPALTKELRASLTKSALTLSVDQHAFSSVKDFSFHRNYSRITVKISLNIRENISGCSFQFFIRNKNDQRIFKQQ